jgi:hypothetical protein
MTNCAVCENQWVDDGDDCGTCPGNWDAATDCTACQTNWEGSDCETCPDNWDPAANCAVCENQWVDDGDDCGTCPGNWDPTADCAICENQWVDDGDDCGTCPGNWDPTADCAACQTNWDEASDCEVCLNGFDPSTDCVACMPGWSGAECEGQSPCIRYTDVDSTFAVPDGKSWYTAFHTVGEAIMSAKDAVEELGGTCEVWVAEGVYFVRNAEYDYSTRGYAVHLFDGVPVYGGFAGTETDRAARDWTANETILDARDGPGAEYLAPHVVYSHYEATPTVSSTTIDGFTIRNGYAISGDPQWGAGVLVTGTETTIRNCRFVDNVALNGGGIAIDTDYGVVVENSTFLDNRGTNAGSGIYVYGFSGEPDVTIANCLFVRGDGNYGGGVYAAGSSTVAVTNSTFYGNDAYFGGALSIRSGAHADVSNSIFWQNSDVDTTEIHLESGTANISRCDVMDGPMGADPITGNPGFEDVASDDYRLAAGSPCIDSGDGDVAPTTDLLGNPRVDDPATEPNTGIGVPDYTDIGAYEYQP